MPISQQTIEVESIKESDIYSLNLMTKTKDIEVTKQAKYDLNRYGFEYSYEEIKEIHNPKEIEVSLLEQTSPRWIEYENMTKLFENNTNIKKLTDNFFKKIENNFKNKRDYMECSSFLCIIHNLYTQHIGKQMK